VFIACRDITGKQNAERIVVVVSPAAGFSGFGIDPRSTRNPDA